MSNKVHAPGGLINARGRWSRDDRNETMFQEGAFAKNNQIGRMHKTSEID